MAFISFQLKHYAEDMLVRHAGFIYNILDHFDARIFYCQYGSSIIWTHAATGTIAAKFYLQVFLFSTNQLVMSIDQELWGWIDICVLRYKLRAVIDFVTE